MAAAAPYTRTIDAVLADLATSRHGLSAAEAAARLESGGLNEIPRAGRRHALAILATQFTNRLILILIAAALISLALGEGVEASVILAIVGLNGILAFLQEYRAERALRELRAYVSHSATVRRDGRLTECPAREIVRGDIVRIGIGDIVPADLRLISVDDLALDEATLTGEGQPVVKTTDPLPGDKAALHELVNQAFQGTAVASGWGEGVVFATGARTAFGRTAAALQHPRPETDFQKNIRRFSDFLLRVTLGMTLFVFAVNAILGKGVFDSLLFALALAVGITPEALPIIVTIALSRGALRMARVKVITKRLIAIEDLGNVDTLCCDKTGTLTTGQLTLADYCDVAGRRDHAVLLGGLLTTAPDVLTAGGTAIGPIDQALVSSDAARQVAGEHAGWEVVDRNEFDFTRRRTSAVVRRGTECRLVVKGAPEAVLGGCATIRHDGQAVPIGEAEGRRQRQLVQQWEETGYRVLAVAERPIAPEATTAAAETGLTLWGYLLFLDPPKDTARESLARLAELGVSIKILTGDSAAVTRKVCGEVGLPVPDDRVVLGQELAALNEGAFREWARRYGVFARVTPEQKAALVAALRREQHIVGFLGDGVNDAPALHVADVGVAVDSGADVAKEASDVILLEKSLRALADGIVEGRKTFGNIVKYISNTISANFGNMSTVALSSLFLPFIPLLPSQILLNNFLSDAPLLAISTDEVDSDLLARPRRWDIGMIAKFMVVFGLLSVAFDMVLIVALLKSFAADTATFRTAWFVESACSEIVVTFAIRTRRAFFRSRPSRWLLWASVLAAGAAILLPFTGLGDRYFEFTALPPHLFLFTLGVVAAYFVSAEIGKRYVPAAGRA